jgi:hypothetical protein
MSFWLTGEEEHRDPRFTTQSLGLYVRAGSWCMSQVRYRPEAEIPAEWIVPIWLVKGWGSTRQAKTLVDNGLWQPAEGGWRYAWIRYKNTPDAVRAERKRERNKWANKVAKARNSPGESDATPRGRYRGELEGNQNRRQKS